VGTAVSLAPKSELDGLLRDFGDDPSVSFFSAVDERLDRQSQLDRLATYEHAPSLWLMHLLRRGNDWHTNEVKALARIASKQASTGHVRSELRDVLANYPLVSLEEAFAAATSRVQALSIRQLLPTVPVADLRELTNRLPEGPGRDVLGEYVEWRESATDTPMDEPTPEPAPQAVPVADLVRDGACEDIIGKEILPINEISALGQPERTVLHEWVRKSLRDLLTDRKKREKHVDLASRRFTLRFWNLVELASALRTELSFREWSWLVRMRFRPAETPDWLTQTYRPRWALRLTALLPRLGAESLDLLVEVMPQPWSQIITLGLAPAVFARTTDSYSRRIAAKQLAHHQHRRLIRQLHKRLGGDELLEALVEAGDCRTEGILLARLAENLQTLSASRHDADEHWLRFIQCSSSSETLQRMFKELFAAQGQEENLRLVQEALNKADPGKALAFYRELMGDAMIKDSGFAWYRLRDLFYLLAEREAKKGLPNSVATLFLELRAGDGANVRAARG
jgi:hypothetical protein